MSSTTVFALTRFTALAAGDVLCAVDISDTTQSAHGSLDAITVTNFFSTIPVPVVVTSASAAAFAVGLTGATNSAFSVDASTALQVAGLKVTGAVTGGTVALVTTDSGAATNLTVNAKGTGTIGIGSVSTGRVTITPVTTITGLVTLTAGVTGPLTVTTTSASGFAVGRLGATTPAFTVDSSTATQVAGFKVTGAATGGTVALVATDSGADASLSLNAKGAGLVSIGLVSTGGITIGSATIMEGLNLDNAATGQSLITFRTSGVRVSSIKSVTANIIFFTDNAGAATITFTGAAMSGVTTLAMTGALSGATSLGFSTNAISTTALTTPGALSATQFTGFASTVSGAVLMGYGTTFDATLKNRAGTDVIGVTANTTGVVMAGALAITGALSGVTTIANSGQQTVTAAGLLYSRTGASTSIQYFDIANTSGEFQIGIEGSAGAQLVTGSAAYSAVITTAGTGKPIYFATNNTIAVTISGTTQTVMFAAGIGLSGQPAPTNGIQFGASAPGSLGNGQMWYDGTDFKVRTAGATKTITIA